ncbi:DUF1553 domain-containing protein [bacterium]|nr:DUF1553 domain-containing protein [bacterium]
MIRASLLTVMGWFCLVSITICGWADDRVEFNRDVRPILSDNCFFCHGPDAGHRQADLRLDVREAAIESGAIQPKDVTASSLIQRILSADPDEVMPPPDSNKHLTAEQKAILQRWVAQGAEYQQHWSYEPPVKAEIPKGQNAIDVLVQRRLSEIGMEPSPRADRRTLIRRLYSDLIGVPPTPEEVAAFIADEQPNAYERLVERVLANPHYGERMAIGWLDVVRFADTIGYHSDTPRNVWPYRDWVIQCFNENKPFDRFTIEQVAGDLLPDANQETRIGSAFNRLLLSTEEGGAQAKDYEARMLTDRVRAIGAGWLGQTTGCAQCHDHKFDPITMRDFYSLGAFFADIQEPILGRREDGMIVATEAERAKLAELDTALAEAQKKRDAAAAALDSAQAAWEAKVATENVVLPEIAGGAAPTEGEKKGATEAATALKKEAKDRSAKEKTAIQTYFRQVVDRSQQSVFDELAEKERDRNGYYGSLAKCLVSVSTTKTRTVRILPRGNWMDESGEVMQPALPHYLPQPVIEGRPLNRLDLAQWLVSRENPLTARTVMNRLWKQFFGTGLSKVLDDLGAQGEPPRNLALLDWLACEFMDSGWDMKHMVTVIVTSQAYQQISTASPERLAADPDNRELARQSAYRVDAELVRDYALSIAGLLSPTIGGPSVKPYQPEGYWENLNFPVRQYVADTGESQHRRGLYTWWQRSFLHPSLLAFDAPSREECCAERNRSNIPQQALILLNDPTYVEAARAFAGEILASSATTDRDRIIWAWQKALQRDPRPEELETIEPLLIQHRQIYQSQHDAATAFLKVGQVAPPDGLDSVELAAWTHIARVLLNLHETMTRS